MVPITFLVLEGLWAREPGRRRPGAGEDGYWRAMSGGGQSIQLSLWSASRLRLPGGEQGTVGGSFRLSCSPRKMPSQDSPAHRIMQEPQACREGRSHPQPSAERAQAALGQMGYTRLWLIRVTTTAGKKGRLRFHPWLRARCAYSRRCTV